MRASTCTIPHASVGKGKQRVGNGSGTRVVKGGQGGGAEGIHPSIPIPNFKAETKRKKAHECTCGWWARPHVRGWTTRVPPSPVPCIHGCLLLYINGRLASLEQAEREARSKEDQSRATKLVPSPPLSLSSSSVFSSPHCARLFLTIYVPTLSPYSLSLGCLRERER